MDKPMREYLNDKPPCIQIDCMCDDRECLQIENHGNGMMVMLLIPTKHGWHPGSVAVPVKDLRAALDKLEAAEKEAKANG